jgi:hypothetical protein
VEDSYRKNGRDECKKRKGNMTKSNMKKKFKQAVPYHLCNIDEENSHTSVDLKDEKN